MKKIIFILLLICLLFVGGVSASSHGLAGDKWGVNDVNVRGEGGTVGSSVNPYAINDFDDLNALDSSTWGNNVYYELTNNITLGANISKRDVQGFYDGKGWTINGMNLFYTSFSGGSSNYPYFNNTNYVNYMLINGDDWNFVFNSCYVYNSVFKNFYMSQDDTASGIMARGSSAQTYNKFGRMENVFLQNITSITKRNTRYDGIVYGTSNTALSGASYSFKNIVVLSSSATGGSSNYRVGSTSTASYTNVYASSDCIPSSTSTSATSGNGKTITSSDYNSQSWWQNTALFDFSSNGNWRWDSTTNLPQLKVPAKITSLVLTSSTETIQGVPITAYVTTEGEDLRYQWYDSDFETLTAVYCSDQTVHPYYQNGGMTVRDNNSNYFRYYTSNETKENLTWTTAYTWNDVNTVGYISNNGGANYIDTGLSANDDYLIESTALFTSSTNFILYGTEGNSTTPLKASSIGFGTQGQWGSNKYAIGSLWSDANITIDDFSQYKDVPLDIRITHNQTVLNGNVYDNPVSRNDSRTLNLFISKGAWLRGQSVVTTQYRVVNGYMKGNIYNFDVSLSGVKLRSYIPIKIGDEYCLYDQCLSGNVIYTNDGSGSGFTGGGEESPLTFSRAIGWNAISGQTTANLSYSQGHIGYNYFKVVVSGVDSVIAGFNPLKVYVGAPYPVIQSLNLVYPRGAEMALGETLRASVMATIEGGVSLSYAWYYSNDNATYNIISGQTSNALMYQPQTENTYYIKSIVSNGMYSTDSITVVPPLNVTVFTGLSGNTLMNVSDFRKWLNHYEYYSSQTLSLGANVPNVNQASIPEFNGTFNGNGYTISGLTHPLINNLSGYVNNLSIENSLISGTYVGALCSNSTESILNNVDIKNVNINGDYAGGIAGAILGNDTLGNCGVVYCTIIGRNSAGGVSAVTQSETNILNVNVEGCDIISSSGKAYGVAP